MDEQKDNPRSIDIRGISCPYTFIRAKLALERLPIGDTLDIILNNKTAIDNLPKAFMYEGQEIVEIKRLNDSDWLIKIRKSR